MHYLAEIALIMQSRIAGIRLLRFFRLNNEGEIRKRREDDARQDRMHDLPKETEETAGS
jgi:hypothetical protein